VGWREEKVGNLLLELHSICNLVVGIEVYNLKGVGGCEFEIYEPSESKYNHS
jgi:hypothetical protein